MNPLNSNPVRALLALTSLGVLAAWYAPSPLVASGPIAITSLPFTIDQPGVYCLTSNLDLSSSEDGIVVEAEHVVIDLGGFKLTGPGQSSGGSAISGEVSSVEIRNGFITKWGNDGIRLNDFCRVENVVVRFCGDRGIQLGSYAQLDKCLVDRNDGVGIKLRSHGQVRDCQVLSISESESITIDSDCTLERVQVEGGSTGVFGQSNVHMTDCFAVGFSKRGFLLGDRAILTRCLVQTDEEESEVGIYLNQFGILNDCQVSGKVKVGIFANEHANLTRCHVTGTRGFAIEVDAGSRIEGCIVTNSNSSGQGPNGGIVAGVGSSVQNTTVSGCAPHGIQILGTFGLVSDCLVYNNVGDAISLPSASVARNNLVAFNQGTGVKLTGEQGLLGENFAHGNDKGIAIQGHSVLVINNRSEGNLGEDYDIPWGNPFGPILNTIGQILGSAPQANF